MKTDQEVVTELREAAFAALFPEVTTEGRELKHLLNVAASKLTAANGALDEVARWYGEAGDADPNWSGLETILASVDRK